MTSDNTFIRITKYSIKEKLKKLKVRTKHQDKICNLIKSNFVDNIDDFIKQAAEEYWKIEGTKKLSDFIKESPDNKRQFL